MSHSALGTLVFTGAALGPPQAFLTPLILAYTLEQRSESPELRGREAH